MATFAMILQLVNATLLVALMAMQSEKVEQGGVMGIGATGGRQSGSVDLLVGGERILKPATRWSAVGLLFSSLLAAIPADKLTPYHFLGVITIYLAIMLYGNRVWRTVLGLDQ